uniref:very-long-chain 3-oxoacyl-CoA reductase-like n=1 Tax=Styela clava TaxID=7725 RepID=UPI00193A47BA|nr:very-long-chain 3-oxoacyl-CoA reductase-like [Styela clava]
MYVNYESMVNNKSWCLYAFGYFSLLYLTVKSCYGLYTFLVTYVTDSPINFKKLGRWAVVTGATDGIGRAIADQLAHRGINIFLISKNQEKLKNVAREIEELYNVETKFLKFNFIRFDTINSVSPYDSISQAVQNLDVGILVNNVGMPAGDVKEFHLSHGPNQTLSIASNNQIHCNASSRAKMTEIILPGMVARKRGLVVNISSMSASHPHPIVSTYAASKRFDDTLSIGLANEYRKHGIVIQSIQPGFVFTNLTKVVIKNANLAVPNAATFARHMMKTLGKADVTSGYWVHAIVRWFYMSLPEGNLARSLRRTFKAFGE